MQAQERVVGPIDPNSTASASMAVLRCPCSRTSKPVSNGSRSQHSEPRSPVEIASSLWALPATRCPCRSPSPRLRTPGSNAAMTVAVLQPIFDSAGIATCDVDDRIVVPLGSVDDCPNRQAQPARRQPASRAITKSCVRRYRPPCQACLGGQSDGSPLRSNIAGASSPPCVCAPPAPAPTHTASQPRTENDMDLQLLIAQWSGKLPEGFAPHAGRQTPLAESAHKDCRNKVAIKRDGTAAHACQRCLDRRARSCRRRRTFFVAQGGCRRCAYRKRAEGDFLCARCREDRDVERAQKRQDALDAAGIDEVRGQARNRAPDEQSGPRSLALEREGQAGAVRRLLVAASRSGAQGRPGVALVAVQRPPAPPVLIRPPRSRRGGSGRRTVGRVPRVGLPSFAPTPYQKRKPLARWPGSPLELSPDRHAVSP